MIYPTREDMDDLIEAGRLMSLAAAEILALRAALEQERADSAKLRKGLTAVEELIADSSGVYGLHRNGDVSPWSELLEGGQFEAWLIDYCIAMDAAKTADAVVDAGRGEDDV